jgi:CHAT domain-containing protein
MFGNPNTKTQAGALLRQVDTQTAELEELEGQIRSTSPHYAALMQPQPLSVREVQGQVLDSDTLLLEYSLGVERSFVWVVTKTSLTAHELPPRSVVEAAAQRVYDLLTARQAPLSRTRLAEADAQYASEAAALSRMVLSPVWSQLGTKRRLLIVGDGRLQYVPFAALPEPARENAEPIPLVVEHEVVSMPSASTIGVLRREISNRAPSPKAVAIFADPVFARDDARVRPSAGLAVTDSRGGMARLLFSRREAAAILAVAPAGQSTQALDFQANRAMVTDAALRQYRIIHFATHGILDSEHPELSGIVLSLVDREGKPQDGFLRLHDFYNMNLPAELVVLSACQTALGKDVKGEGLVGLTRGFMYAGAARVVASLWKVDDAATAELMKRFYQGMLGNQQLSPAAALRAAQLAMLQQKQWASPYYWAAFVHQGEWNTWEKAGN